MHCEGRSTSTSGEQISLNASDVGDPGGGVGGGAISSLNGSGSGSDTDGRSGSGMEASLTSSGYEATDSVTGNQARHHQGAQAQNFLPYGFPGFFPYPGLWQSSHCMSYLRGAGLLGGPKEVLVHRQQSFPDLGAMTLMVDRDLAWSNKFGL